VTKKKKKPSPKCCLCDQPGLMKAPSDIAAMSDPYIPAVPDGEWLCEHHCIQRLQHPKNMAMTRAGIELDEFIEDGGRLS
jgi:hypothetical protein